jgi:hypothetical protein
MASAPNFSQTARSYRGLSHTVPPSISGTGSFGRSAVPQITTTSAESHGTSHVLNNAAVNGKAPKSGSGPGEGPGWHSPIIEGEELGPMGNAGSSGEPQDVTLTRTRPAPDLEWRPTAGWQSQPGIERPAITGNPGIQTSHPLTASLHRAAIEGPTHGLGGFSGGGFGEPPALAGAPLSPRPLLPGSGGAARVLQARATAPSFFEVP